MPVRAKSADEPIDQQPVSDRSVDLIDYLEHTLPRRVGDMLKITQIPGTHSFRANWYDSHAAGSSAVMGLSIAYIRESKFLHCRIGPDGRPEITYPKRQ